MNESWSMPPTEVLFLLAGLLLTMVVVAVVGTMLFRAYRAEMQARLKPKPPPRDARLGAISPKRPEPESRPMSRPSMACPPTGTPAPKVQPLAEPRLDRPTPRRTVFRESKRPCSGWFDFHDASDRHCASDPTPQWGLDPGGVRKRRARSGHSFQYRSTEISRPGSRMALRRDVPPAGDPILGPQIPLGESSHTGDLQLSFARQPLVDGHLGSGFFPSHGHSFGRKTPRRNPLVQDITVGDPDQSFFEEKFTPVKGFGIVVAGDGNEVTARRHELILQVEPSLSAAFLECGVVGFVPSPFSTTRSNGAHKDAMDSGDTAALVVRPRWRSDKMMVEATMVGANTIGHPSSTVVGGEDKQEQAA